MKIDYDKPVKGRLALGYYWMRNDSPFLMDGMAIVARDGATRLYVAGDTQPGSNMLRRASEWRKYGWQFYRVRLPKPAKEAR